MLATFAAAAFVGIAVDLSLPADHVPEKRHQGLAARCLRLSPKVALERLNVGYTAVVLVQESRVGSTENVLPAHTVGRNQYHVAGREVRLSADRHQCAEVVGQPDNYPATAHLHRFFLFHRTRLANRSAHWRT